eukprot:TRINITY_DN22559_c0_g2_i1.p1 TRINITY_DN22559_c0_g2~~TRINITY_DN22559_c0_g2_i1.p1  ORF type:complete len:703 (-),score=112.61 TRINITY_DN22559_c0_g2_i1:9-2078(-)
MASPLDPAFHTPSPLGARSYAPAGVSAAWSEVAERASSSSAAVPTTPAFRGGRDLSEIDWLLVGQTKVSLVAGACLAIGLRFAGTGDASAKRVLMGRLRELRDARRSTEHAARMASLPTPGMDLDRSTLETCQSVVAMALGMVLAGTGDLDALRLLRAIRKRSDLETSYGVHMATHMAIGFIFLGGGKYTFDQEPLSIAMLLMAAFPRFPTSLNDNRCHLQAFRHLYVLAARHRCVEAVDADTRQSADVSVLLKTERGVEEAALPRLMLSSKDLQSVTLSSDRYYPVSISRNPVSASPLALQDRWMRSLELSRRMYVKRRCGHPARGPGIGDSWFPCFAVPRAEHLERLLMPGMPCSRAAGSAASSADTDERLCMPGSVALSWLRNGTEAGAGDSVLEWASALCCEAAPLLPDGVYELDFEDGDDVDGDGTLSECFASLLNAVSVDHSQSGQSLQARYAHWLYECVAESKVAAFPMYLLLHAQARDAGRDVLRPRPSRCGPSAAVCSVLAVDQLLTLEHFYRSPRAGAWTGRAPLLSDVLLAGRCAEVQAAFDEGGEAAPALDAALRAHVDCSASPAQDLGIHAAPIPVPADDNSGAPASNAAAPAEAAALALFSRLHGLPPRGAAAAASATRGGAATASGTGVDLRQLPRLRRLLPETSAAGLRQLAAALARARAKKPGYERNAFAQL